MTLYIDHDYSIQPYSYSSNAKIVLNPLGPAYASHQYQTTPNNTFVSTCNPLTRDAPRGGVLSLNRPHLQTRVTMRSDGSMPGLYSKRQSLYGKHYDNYNTVSGGNIQYWVRTDSSDPYNDPVYSTPALVRRVVRTDPMGVEKPVYVRQSVSTPECMSSTADALLFREDLMERQSRLYNRSSSVYRYPIRLQK